METLINHIIEVLQSFVLSQPLYVSCLIGCFLIILESIIPPLPLAVFIALNIILLGNVLGFVVSWLATVMGCLVSYMIFKKGFSKKLYRNLDHHPKVKRIVKSTKNISFTNLVIILAIPFTPAFSINIGAGLSRMRLKKFFFAVLISKIFIVYFWGYIGTTFVQSMTDIGVLFKLGIILLCAFILSKIALKKFHLE